MVIILAPAAGHMFPDICFQIKSVYATPHHTASQTHRPLVTEAARGATLGGDCRPAVNCTGVIVNTSELRKSRDEIDRLDAEIVRLLHTRAGVAQQIGALKDAASRGAYAPEREREVLERVQ